MKEQAEELIDKSNSILNSEGKGMMELIKTIEEVIDNETLYGNEGQIIDILIDLIKDSNDRAIELIDMGNSREQAEGLGMIRVTEPISKLINIDGEISTDNEIIDMIYDLIINNR
tara:strand:+ start:227 stop:571 length:345 start_codon:yes stop_codon:yes gene_type:complete